MSQKRLSQGKLIELAEKLGSSVYQYFNKRITKLLKREDLEQIDRNDLANMLLLAIAALDVNMILRLRDFYNVNGDELDIAVVIDALSKNLANMLASAELNHIKGQLKDKMN